MSNRRGYGNDRGGQYSGNNYGGNNSGGRFNSGPSVSPWQSGSIPARNTAASPLAQKLISNFQMNQPADSSVAIATILSSILQQNQPPSLMSLNAGNFGFNNRFMGGNSSHGNERNRRDDRRSDQYRGNRRPPKDRNRDHKSGDKGRYERPKKNEDDADNKEASREKKKEDVKEEPVAKKDEPVAKKDVDEAPKEKSDDAETKDDKEKKEPEGPLPGYENIPAKLFHCHVCGKTMWNDVSFDTHVKGRNHRNKLRDLEDSYQLQTDLMRQIASLSLRLEEMRRGKRRPYPDQYCKMCDLRFNGMTMFAHRSTDEHQNLKRFIHPTCQLCNVDFQVRVEYDEHILSAGHLQEEAKALLRREKFEKDPTYVALREQEAKFRLLLDEVNNIGTGTSGPEVSEDDKKLLETLGEEGQVPPYNPESEIVVARQHISPVEGFLCKICKVFLLSPETVDVHCKTQNHYEAYVGQLKFTAAKQHREKENAEDKRKAEESSENSPKRLKTDEEQDGVNGDESSQDDSTAAETDKLEETSAQPAENTKASPAGAKSPRRGRGRGRGRRFVK